MTRFVLKTTKTCVGYIHGFKVEDATAKSSDDLLPVTLLCGFLGAGKTTMMKHILETKHEDPNFKCAVIVNDMAALNIDKSLIDQSALVQSDEVIAMQNGCFCCTLSNDLVDQIKDLASKNMFNYMLLEASGVSEPSQIAPLFDLCDDNHNHAEAHVEGPQLGEVARLDTCVTVIDGAEFHNSLDSMAEVSLAINNVKLGLNLNVQRSDVARDYGFRSGEGGKVSGDYQVAIR